MFVIDGDRRELERIENLELVLEVKEPKIRAKSVSGNLRRLMFVLYSNSPELQQLFDTFEDYYLSEYAIMIHNTILQINDLRNNGSRIQRQDIPSQNTPESSRLANPFLFARPTGHCRAYHWDGFPEKLGIPEE